MKNKSEGFALLEVVISIVLLGFFLAGAASLIWSAINASERNRARITATYLTQECLELARNARDTAWRQHLPWDCAFSENTTCSDLQKNTIGKFLSTASNPTFENVLLGPDQNIDSQFFRQLMVVPQEDETLIMTCKTAWKPRKNNAYGEQVSMSQVLTNWKKK